MRRVGRHILDGLWWRCGALLLLVLMAADAAEPDPTTQPATQPTTLPAARVSVRARVLKVDQRSFIELTLMNVSSERVVMPRSPHSFGMTPVDWTAANSRALPDGSREAAIETGWNVGWRG